MVAWSQPTRGADGDQIMDLDELTVRLHRNETVTRAMLDALEAHAAILSQSICDDYKALDSIMIRHEALIRQKWMKKTVAQRRKILLAAWPNMPEVHRPDNSIATEQAMRGLKPRVGRVPDYLTWPFINQEDLTTPRTLLVFLNARARKAPWEFAAIETEFSPLLIPVLKACPDKDFCTSTKIHFTEAVDPATYGRVRKTTNSSSKRYGINDGYDFCARPSFQVLLIQQRILAFLLACARAILHNLTDDLLFNGPVQEEPPIEQILVEKYAEHGSFTDVLNLAPYRGWDSLNFSRLRGYVMGTLSTQRNHIWALREDPGYFADTVQEYLDHSLHAILSVCQSQPHTLMSSSEYKTLILADVLSESFAMLNAWDYLNTRLEKYDELLQEGATKQQRVLPILEFEKMARTIGTWLLNIIYCCSRAAPGSRLMLFRKCGTAVYDHQYQYAYDMPAAEKEVLDLFEAFRWKKDDILNWPVFLSFNLERVDRLLQTSATARRMITGRMMSLLTDLSIITECLRQISLWSRSPDVKTGKVDGCGCKVTVHEEVTFGFDKWNSALQQDFLPPLDLIFPLQGKLKYPEHKKRSRDTVTTMRKAEVNLDRFWAAIDSHYQQKTGVAQHRAIRECLEGNGKMHRTTPWENHSISGSKSTKTPDHEFQSIPNQLHDKAAQITGAFDRMAVVEKTKPKTRGSTDSEFETMKRLAVEPSCTATETVKRVFAVDKRTCNVFKTLFSVSSEDIGEVSKSAKWAEFIQAMIRIGFSVEKLQGSAWQFTPTTDVGTERGIQFHEPHPDNEINYVTARRIGRRLGRVYGWCGSTFQLA